jgi:putative redox protein
MSSNVMVTGGHSGLRQVISTGSHRFVADEPKAVGGNDEGPDPYALLLGALGACTNMTLRMYADRKGWSVQEIRVSLSHWKDHAADCANCEREDRMIERIQRRITIIGELTQEQRQRLLAIANRCPVHRTLTSKIEIQTDLLENV